MTLHVERHGSGKPLVLVHGLGGSSRSWDPVVEPLARHREVILIDLPGHGRSPLGPTASTFAGLVGRVEIFIAAEGLQAADLVGSSMGARLVLELACRGHAGVVVALDPGGFWKGWERHFFAATIGLSGRLVRALQPLMPAITRSAIGRSLLLAQLSARPWKLDRDFVLHEMQSIASTRTFDALTRDLAYGAGQAGKSSTAAPMVIGWGREDRLCLPRQAARAKARFPQAHVHWFDRCGHLPMWDQPAGAIELILASTR